MSGAGWFGGLSIRGKLMAMSFLATGAALLLACGSILVYERATFRGALVRTLTPQADIVGSNSASALLFQDRGAAAETLAALRAEPHVVSAGIYGTDGAVFATYLRGDVPAASAVPELPRDPAAGPIILGEHLVIFRPIEVDGERVGTVFIRSDFLELDERLRRYAAILAAVAIASFALALLVASRIQRTISGPVLRLAETARVVSTEKSYAVRAPRASPDEIGLLVDTFNEMLAQIQRRDLELETARSELERRVEERTGDLQDEIARRRLLEEELRSRNEQLEVQNRRVREASRMKSEFLANMSHELRTPLNAIIGFSELMVDEIAGPVSPQQSEYLGHVLDGARHLLQLVNDILDLSKVEAGKMEFRPEPLDPAKVVAEVCDILRSLSSKKRIRVGAEVDPALGPVVLDPAKLKQVMYNFLSNALKFTPDEGRVTIRVRAEGAAELGIEVEDTGIGIRPEDQGRLFVEFQQLDGGAAKKYAGTGLGLAFTKRLVEAQGGRVGVRSQVGRGSVFFAVLPRVGTPTRPAPEPAETPARAGPPGASGAPTILVVEDDEKDREWLVRTLAGAGYRVEAAASGTDAIARTRERVYAAITLDLLLPDIGGREVLRTIRSEGLNRETATIIVSIVSEREAGAGFAIHDFLTKPARAEDLFESLGRAGVRPAGGRPVLVVDDDPGSLRLMDATLRELGYRPALAEDGEAGLRAAAAEAPAAVVLDLLMPRMDGFEFLERFRATVSGRTTPVVIWSVKELTPEERTRLKAMAQGFIAKGRAGAATLLLDLRSQLGPLAPAEPLRRTS